LIFKYKSIKPDIGEGCYIAESAEVLGKVPLGKLAAGAPVRIIGDVREDYKKDWARFKQL